MRCSHIDAIEPVIEVNHILYSSYIYVVWVHVPKYIVQVIKIFFEGLSPQILGSLMQLSSFPLKPEHIGIKSIIPLNLF